MKSSRWLTNLAFVAMCVVAVSCGTGKNIAGGSPSSAPKGSGREDAEARKMTYLRKVYDNEVFAKSLSSKIKFTLTSGSKDITVSGSLKMKKDEVIRIQLTPFGLMEAGRLEFAKDYVLIMDRINKEYVKAGYDEVDFLRVNGLDFYALQALFWNQLFVPGTQKITDSSLRNFGVTFDDATANTLISLVRGNMSYAWSTDKASGRIKSVDVTYNSKTNGKTSVNCSYGSFKPFASKHFPSEITLKMSSDAVKSGKKITMNIAISNFDTSSDWETNTSISSKYKRVSAQDVMNRLLKM